MISYPILAKERKIVLVELSKLVACARSASGACEDGEQVEVDEAKEMDGLSKAARGVFASVKRFLHLANDCGVQAVTVQEVEGSAGDGGPPRPYSNPCPSSAFGPDSLHSERNREGSNGSTRMQEAFRLKAASIGDLRAARPRASSPPPPLPTASGLVSIRSGRARSPSTASTPMSATFASSSGSGRSSPVSIKSFRDRRLQGSVDSGSYHSHAPSSDHGHPWEATPVPTPPTAVVNRQLGSTPDVHDAISLAEDTLLSIIAAFIGHIHSHHIGSHPSSHAHLIEMTRETIDAVRELLTIVETVGRQAGMGLARPREIHHLRAAKDNLYEVASRLVEGAEAVANAGFSTGEDRYDVEKGRLLQTATGTLRAGTECVRLVKLCLPDEDTPQINLTPRQGDTQTRQSTPRPPQEAGLVLRDRIVGVRGAHILSTLERKATNLSTLQKSYQQDSGIDQAPLEDDENGEQEEEDEEIVQDAGHEEDMTMKPIVIVSLNDEVEYELIKQIRPPMLQAVTLSVVPLATKSSEGMLRSFSKDTGNPPRSRSSSLTSPAPPQRIKHRSPSRSADLDKFTDCERLTQPTRQASSASLSTASRSSTYTTSSTAETSTLSSGISEHQPPAPQTPYAHSAILGYLKTEVSTVELLPKLANLSIDPDTTEITAVKPKILQRPSPPVRAATAPIPWVNTDVRSWVVAHDYDPREITFNPDGNVIGASLAVLIEKMTSHDGPVDPSFSAGFFFTFRLFTTPVRLLETLIQRYDLQPPPSMALGERERTVWIDRKVVPVRLRIYNLLRAWLDTHWQRESDDAVLGTLRLFAAGVVSRTLPAMAPRLLDALRSRQNGPSSGEIASRHIRRHSSMERLRGSAQAGILHPPAIPGGLPPTPVISKTLNSLLQKNALSIPITEFDTLELARQLTIMESKLFCAVIPEDLLQTGRKTISSLKALSTLSNQITGWVADNILNEMDAKKRAALLKFYIKLADVSAPGWCWVRLTRLTEMLDAE